jgi:urease accessory protein UreF
MKAKTKRKGAENAEARKVTNSPAMMTVFERIAKMRLVQRQSLRQGLCHLDMAGVVPDENRKLRRLTQLTGYVGETLESREESERIGARTEMHDALVMLAACTVAWLECLEKPAQPMVALCIGLARGCGKTALKPVFNKERGS